VNENFTYEQTRQSVLEHLRHNISGSFYSLLEGIYGTDGAQYAHRERMREIMWRLMVEGIIFFGKNAENPNWPWYCVTEWGRAVLKETKPQPYDPDGFIAFFRQEVASVDPVVQDYFVEALRAFMADCQKSAAVMLGAAHEQAILNLIDQFGQAIADVAKREPFLKKTERGGIFQRFDHLMQPLSAMAASKKLPGGLREYVETDILPAFNVIRLTRNAAGHPEIIQQVGRDENFMHLRMAVHHSKHIHMLIEHFKANPAEV